MQKHYIAQIIAHISGQKCFQKKNRKRFSINCLVIILLTRYKSHFSFNRNETLQVGRIDKNLLNLLTTSVA